MLKTLPSALALGLVIGGALPLAAQDRPATKNPEKPRVAQEEKEKPRAKRVQAGEKAPDFELKSIDGKAMTLRQLRGLAATPPPEGAKDPAGKIVVLDFWSIRCPVSRGWEKRLTALAKEYGAKGVVFVAIDSNRAGEAEKSHESDADIKAYCKEQAIPYVVLLDEKAKIADRFRALKTPDVFVVDAQGNVAFTGAIDDDAGGENPEKRKNFLADALTALLAGKAPETKDVAPVGCSIKRPTPPEKAGN